MVSHHQQARCSALGTTKTACAGTSPSRSRRTGDTGTWARRREAARRTARRRGYQTAPMTPWRAEVLVVTDEDVFPRADGDVEVNPVAELGGGAAVRGDEMSEERSC